ncbi:MAG: hypothetical protein AAGU21_01105 [Solidesulfovibrio sp.]|uniref:hypothetical protein n=1 Tax=Solidesulfovibrio sp. TaxID=2910990 RepID=UPI002B1F83C9|nr:hypothetical protein [Solidesulfovibrio sp.]MEA4857919.1 hypothetical protein [Solidesulfovibrio sp.]
MSSVVYVGDIGTELLVDCGQDISGATNTFLTVRFPSGNVVNWPATVATVEGKAQFLRCLTRAGDLAEAGNYRVQAMLTLGDWSGSGKTAVLQVRERFA